MKIKANKLLKLMDELPTLKSVSKIEMADMITHEIKKLAIAERKLLED